MEAAGAGKAPGASTGSVPPPGSKTERPEGSGGHPCGRGPHQVLGATTVVADTSFRWVFHSPVDGLVEAVTGTAVDGPYERRRPQYLEGAALLKGAAIRCMVRGLKDPDRVPRPSSSSGAPVEGPSPEVGRALLPTGAVPPKGCPNEDKVDRVVVHPRASHGAAPEGGLEREDGRFEKAVMGSVVGIDRVTAVRPAEAIGALGSALLLGQHPVHEA